MYPSLWKDHPWIELKILFVVIICHMLFIPIIIKLHTQKMVDLAREISNKTNLPLVMKSLKAQLRWKVVMAVSEKISHKTSLLVKLLKFWWIILLWNSISTHNGIYGFPHQPVYSGHIICQLYVFISGSKKNLGKWTSIRKIISNRSRPIFKILKNCHWINCKLQFKMYPILFAVIICHMLFIPIIIKLHTQNGWPCQRNIK